MNKGYAFNKEVEKNMAKAYGRSLNISTKQSVEICNALRGKSVQKAKLLLENVIEKKAAIPMRRYNRDTAHKVGMAAGKYPISASKSILAVVKNAESNAQNKGLNVNNLFINHISAHIASRSWHYGRQKRSRMKSTHIQIIVMEKKESKENKK